MASSNPKSWHPTEFKSSVGEFNTSTGPARILTDAGEAVMKALGNREGPHALARELIAIRLANWFELPTFEHSILNVKADDDIPLGHNMKAEAGPSFVTKYHKGHSWSGDKKELKSVDNCEIITRLVVFDTWILNVDRYPPENTGRRPNYANVFLSEVTASPGKFRMITMDHTHCLRANQDLNANIKNINNIKDIRIYGAFPAFRDFIRQKYLTRTIDKLKSFSDRDASDVIANIPNEWLVNSETKDSLREFFLGRAQYLIETLSRSLSIYNLQQGNLAL